MPGDGHQLPPTLYNFGQCFKNALKCWDGKEKAKVKVNVIRKRQLEMQTRAWCVCLSQSSSSTTRGNQSKFYCIPILTPITQLNPNAFHLLTPSSTWRTRVVLPVNYQNMCPRRSASMSDCGKHIAEESEMLPKKILYFFVSLRLFAALN